MLESMGPIVVGSSVMPPGSLCDILALSNLGSMVTGELKFFYFHGSLNQGIDFSKVP